MDECLNHGIRHLSVLMRPSSASAFFRKRTLFRMHYHKRVGLEVPSTGMRPLHSTTGKGLFHAFMVCSTNGGAQLNPSTQKKKTKDARALANVCVVNHHSFNRFSVPCFFIIIITVPAR